MKVMDTRDRACPRTSSLACQDHTASLVNDLLGLACSCGLIDNRTGAARSSCAMPSLSFPAVLLATSVVNLNGASQTESALERFNATFRGLQHYYWNSTGNVFTCCGESGTAGGASRFGCVCETPDGVNCVNCYRWWYTTALQVLIQLNSSQIAPPGLHDTVSMLAATILRNSPYSVEFGRARSWVYVDDYGWYVLAYLSAYEHTGETKYLAEARDTFDWLWQISWDQGCGGVYWIVTPFPVAEPPRKYKNTITNLLMLQAAIRLHLFLKEARFKEQALQLWKWFEEAPLRDADGLLGDGVSADPSVQQSDCCTGAMELPSKPRCVRNNKPVYYTYNQGMFVGAAGLMFHLTGNQSYVKEGLRTLQAVLDRMTLDGVLREPFPYTFSAPDMRCATQFDPGPNGDGNLHNFKGVFMVQLAEFLRTVPIPAFMQERFERLIEKSSDAAWALRSEPPWPTSPPDVCADPAFADITTGPPRFPWYWIYVGDSPANESFRVCMDTRTQISALALFAAHAVTSSAKRDAILSI